MNLENTCYIVGAASLDGVRLSPRPGDYVIAADGGYRSLKARGIEPDFVMGDFDSLGYRPDHPNVETHPVMKDDTDLGLAVREDSENPIYYIQYAHARICTLLAAMAEAGCAVPAAADVDAALLTTPQERELIKQIAMLPEEIHLAARDYDPSRINRYVTELAARFHRFYNVCRIKDAEPAVRDARLKLADTTRRVLEIGLGIIGVTAPEKM